MFANQSTAATPLTLTHHACDAMMYGRWSEAERLMRRAELRIIEEAEPLSRLEILSALVDFEPSPQAFHDLRESLTARLGYAPDVWRIAELAALVAQLQESSGEPDAWVAFLDQEIDTTLTELLTTKDNHHV